MRLPHTIIGAALIGAIVIGCSKSSSPQPQAAILTNAPEAPAFTTSLSNVWQAKLQEVQTNIQAAQVRLDLLRKTFKTNDQVYLDERNKLAQMLSVRRLLWMERQASTIDQQLERQTFGPKVHNWTFFYNGTRYGLIQYGAAVNHTRHNYLIWRGVAHVIPVTPLWLIFIAACVVIAVGGFIALLFRRSERKTKVVDA